MRIAKCKCGSDLLEAGQQGQEDMFWLHKDTIEAERGDCEFIEGSQEEVTQEEYDAILNNLKGEGNAGLI